MKVVIFAGGLGTRMREETEFRPKPMVEIGGKPVLWHIMKVYAQFGYDDFVVLTGYKGHVIRDFFQNYAYYAQDFTTKLGGKDSTIFHGENEESKWQVTVADTGPTTQTGGRLLQAQRYLEDSAFMCTYGDGLAPVNIEELVATHQRLSLPATMTVTQQRSRFGVAKVNPTGIVTSFAEKPLNTDLVNIGFFVFEPDIFEFLDADSALENEPLRRLVATNGLAAFNHTGFWQPMDTAREYADLNDMWDKQQAPWKIW